MGCSGGIGSGRELASGWSGWSSHPLVRLFALHSPILPLRILPLRILPLQILPGRILHPLILLPLLLLGTLLPAGGQAQTLSLPPIPDDGFFVQDLAHVLDGRARYELGLIQEEAFQAHHTPIIVVTIPRRAEFGGGGMSMEEFATDWFDHWEIGARGPDGALRNQGILLLISVGDREARIELGADWGRRWDAHAGRIMDERMVPAFQEGDYDKGAVEGAWALLAMAELGPDAAPPRDPRRWVRSLGDSPLDSTPLPLWGTGILMVTGLVLIGLSFRIPEHRTVLLVAGVVLIIGALFIWFLLAILAALIGRRFDSGGGSAGGGFRSSGGFGGGGFSGGGGATGRW
jgi:uncharacterized protein